LNTDKALLKAMKVLPALSTIHVPSLNGSAPLTAHDLELLTWPKDRRLWLDLRYDRYEQPALTDMFLVSRGSRRVRTTVEELEAVLSGRKYNQWRGSDVGAVTMLKTDDGHIVTAWEALKRGVGGEVICVAK
jgi:ribosomal protein S8